MLSYRHAFHAGNHADVLKHLCLLLALQHLAKKDKPLCYVDTHAGPGSCSLDAGPATLNAEHEAGIARLLMAHDLPEPLGHYVELIRGFNPDGRLVTYPGSPAIARRLLPEHSRMELSELHPDDFKRLQAWASGTRRIRVAQEDGFRRLKALLPPVERRALVLIDPPYEIKQDYTVVVAALQGALRRFATGVYLLWYPLLQRLEVAALLRTLELLQARQLQVELRVRPETTGGMYGSGMFIINPPFQMADQLQVCKPALLQHLAQHEDASFHVTLRGMS